MLDMTLIVLTGIWNLNSQSINHILGDGNIGKIIIWKSAQLNPNKVC